MDLATSEALAWGVGYVYLIGFAVGLIVKLLFPYRS